MLKKIVEFLLGLFKRKQEEEEEQDKVVDLRKEQVGKQEPLWMPQVMADLKRHEGYREYAYPDPHSEWGRLFPGYKHNWGRRPASVIMAELGLSKDDITKGAPWTVGYGFTGGVRYTSRTTHGESTERLRTEVIKHAAGLDSLVPEWRTEQGLVAQSVLVNMVYNLGHLRLAKFAPTLALFAKKDYAGAAARLRNTAWWKQTGARAQELVERLETGRIREEHRVY